MAQRFEPAVPLCPARAGRPQGNGWDILGELPGVGRFDTVPPRRACDPAARLCRQLEADAGSVGRAVYFADVAKEPADCRRPRCLCVFIHWMPRNILNSSLNDKNSTSGSWCGAAKSRS